MNEELKKKAEEANARIVQSIKVSQMMDTEGYKVLEKFLMDKEKEYEKVNVFELKDMDIVNRYQGMEMMLLEINKFLGMHAANAMNPMTDIKTGKTENINKKNPRKK